MKRNERAICELVACALASIAMVVSAAQPAPEARWGVYASLAGKQGTFTDGRKQFREEYTWTVPGKTLLLRRVEMASSKEWYRAEITLLDAPGNLHAEYSGRYFFGPREIHLLEDGSALWTRGKFTEPAVLVEATADGGWSEKVVTADSDDHIKRVRSELIRSLTGHVTPTAVIARETDSATKTGKSGQHEGMIARLAPATLTASTAKSSPAAATKAEVVKAETEMQARATPGSTAAQPPLSPDKQWMALGPLSHFINQVLYDEHEEDLIAIAKTDGGIGIASPDGAPKDFTLRAVATTTFTGRPTFLRFSHGVEAFKEKGNILPDGSIRFRWHSMILGATFEDIFSLSPKGCMKWVGHSHSGDVDNTTNRTFCRITKESEIMAAAQKHAERNIRNGMDSASFNRSVRELQAKATEDERRQAANKEQDGNGWVGTLIGAAAGVAAAKSYGGNSEDVANAALMGAAISNPGNAALTHGANVFRDEMASKDAEQAAANASIAQLAGQAEAAQSERQRQQLERETSIQQEQTEREQASRSAIQQRERTAHEQQAQFDSEAAAPQRMASHQSSSGSAGITLAESPPARSSDAASAQREQAFVLPADSPLETGCRQNGRKFIEFTVYASAHDPYLRHNPVQYATGVKAAAICKATFGANDTGPSIGQVVDTCDAGSTFCQGLRYSCEERDFVGTCQVPRPSGGSRQ